MEGSLLLSGQDGHLTHGIVHPDSSSLEFESVCCGTAGSASWVPMLSASIDRQQVSGSAKMLILIVGYSSLFIVPTWGF